MSLLPLFQWMNDTSIGVAVRESTWLFPTFEVVHLLALAVLGGSVLLVDLRLLGLGLTSVSPHKLATTARPWFRGSIAAIVASGIPLLLAEAIKCYETPAFWAKMGLLFLALIYAACVRPHWLTDGAGAFTSRAQQLAGAGSIALWLGVGAAGRAIAFW